jgi:hypothetical protein
MMHEPPHDAVSFHLPQLLNEHLLGDGGNGAPQFREAPHLTAEQVKQNHQLPAALQDPQHFFDPFAADASVCFCLPFGKNLTFVCVLAMQSV